jgi:hypothetical protein
LSDIPPGPADPSWPARLLEMVGRVVEPDDNPAGAVYGTITCGALLAAEASEKETFVAAAGAVAVTLVLYAVAHGYAQELGQRLDEGVPMGWGRLRHLALHEASLLRGAAVPLAVMLLAGASGAGVGGAEVAGLIAAAVTLVALELIAVVRARLRRGELVVHLGIGAVLGLGILALRVLLH